MITKRIIPCLDVRDGRVVKGVNFEGLRDVSGPAELARYYSENGADELVFYDITASAEGRRLFADALREVARTIFIPLTVGGGISSMEDFDRVLKCGADKVSVNTGAIRDPELVRAAAENAAGQLAGAVTRRTDAVYALLTDILAHFAAALDYPAPYLHAFAADETFTIKDLQIRSFRTSHYAKESVGYRIESSDGSLAVLTDTGFITDDAHDAALGADMLLLESNHDVIMLKNGDYPYYLKQRILGECGHLSNEAAAEFAVECVRAGTSDILLAHLSDENNSPQLAEYTVGRALQASGLSVRLSAAPRDTISEVHICRRSPSFASEN